MLLAYTLAGILAIIVYVVGLGVYRLYFSPIRHIPGPKLAALTLWYEFYYDCIVGGKYTFQIQKMHEKYGPIIRINPYEVHLSDPEYFNSVYAGGNQKRDKWGWYITQFGTQGSVLSTPSHEHHRLRRTALNQFFSLQSVKLLQPLIQEQVDAVLRRFNEFKKSKKVFDVTYLYAAYTNDVIMQYAFGWNEKAADAPDFLPDIHDSFLKTAYMGHAVKQFPWLIDIMDALPEWLVVKLVPALAASLDRKRAIKKHITQIVNEGNEGNEGNEKSSSYRTIFHDMLSKLPAEETKISRLADEAFIVVGAGTTTTTWTLSLIHYYLLKNPAILNKLKAELATALPNANATPSLTELEHLPYLNGVIKEGLRFAYGISTRSQRISREPFIVNDGFKDWTIPPNTPISMTSVLIHHNEKIFPNSKVFNPERWIDNPRLDKYLVSFSKGSRQCVGMNLAYAELYLALTAIWRRYGSSDTRRNDDVGIHELFETTDKDVEIETDWFLPVVEPGSQGIRIKVLE